MMAKIEQLQRVAGPGLARRIKILRGNQDTAAGRSLERIGGRFDFEIRPAEN
jgi:hypothetical protein